MRNLLLLVLIIYSCSAENITANKYELVNNWPLVSSEVKFGNPTGLALNSKQNLVVFHRGSRSWQNPMPIETIKENTILEIDINSGKIINSWGSDFFIMPHGLEVDREDNIWVSDVGLHQVIKFDPLGNQVMIIGEKNKPGNDENHFNLPTDIAVAKDGSFYVSDGYGNSRIIKFSKNGDYLFEWGIYGNSKSEFNIPHALDLDDKGYVYVADRENNKIQKFDSLGNFIAQWKNKSIGQLYSINVNNHDNLLVGIDYTVRENGEPIGSDIIHFDLDLNLKSRFGRSGSYSGPKARYHDVQIDKKGNIFVGDILNNSVQMFRPIN